MATKYLWLNPFCVYYLVKEGLIGYRKINKNSVGSKGEIMGLCTIYNCMINQNKCGKDCCGFFFFILAICSFCKPEVYLFLNEILSVGIEIRYDLYS